MITNAEKEIKKYFEKYDLDLRKSKFSRFMDQKVTPDVVCFIADCIINLVPIKKEFSRKDIEDSDYFEKNVRAIYGKPSPKKESVNREYDKFIGQPLRMLDYAQILSCTKKGNKNIYSLKEKNILEFISTRERNAFLFLFFYIEKILNDSGIIRHFEEFKNKCKSKKVVKEDYIFLKNKYIQFFKGNTKIKGDYEIPRMFPKILNIYSVYYHIQGSKDGNLSKYPFNFSDLMYNHENWRDVGKAKSLTRQESIANSDQKKIHQGYLIKKAKDAIRKKYGESEVHDSFSRGTASHVHHIFSASNFPQLVKYLENLIKLTATQHLEKAHPKGKTQIIDKDYQCVCLLAKSESVEKSLDQGEMFYSKEDFIYVVNEGLNLSLKISLNFDNVRDEINKKYNEF